MAMFVGVPAAGTAESESKKEMTPCHVPTRETRGEQVEGRRYEEWEYKRVQSISKKRVYTETGREGECVTETRGKSGGTMRQKVAVYRGVYQNQEEGEVEAEPRSGTRQHAQQLLQPAHTHKHTRAHTHRFPSAQRM